LKIAELFGHPESLLMNCGIVRDASEGCVLHFQAELKAKSVEHRCTDVNLAVLVVTSSMCIEIRYSFQKSGKHILSLTPKHARCSIQT
jgi:hypothetical protein